MAEHQNNPSPHENAAPQRSSVLFCACAGLEIRPNKSPPVFCSSPSGRKVCQQWRHEVGRKKKKERRELIKKNQKTRVLQRQIHGQFLPCSIWKETPSQTQHCLLPLRGTFFLVSKQIPRRHKSERKGSRKESHQKSQPHERGGAAEPCIKGCRRKSRIRGKVCDRADGVVIKVSH